MKFELLDQFAGENTVADELNGLLANRRWKRLRMLVAFVRWSGLSLIDQQLQDFVSRGGTVDAFVGIDLGGTHIEALDYLHQLPNTRVRVVHANSRAIVFHPKVYIFDDGKDAGPWAAIVGSSNLSAGGIWNNSEAGILCTGRSGSSRPFEPLWERYEGVKPPLKSKNIIELDDASLRRLAKHLEPYSVPGPDSGRSKTGMSRVPGVPLTRRPPPTGRPPLPTRPKTKGRSSGSGPGAGSGVKAPSKALTLYLEQWGETGGGGTQTQIPKEVAENYFGHRPGVVTWLTLNTPTGTTKVRLSSFSNVTYRITLGFTRGKARPAVLRFKRVRQDEYDVEARSENERGYAAWKRYCTQGGGGAKKFGIVQA